MQTEYDREFAESPDEALANIGVTTRFLQLRKEREERAVPKNGPHFKIVLHPHARAHDLNGAYAFITEGHRVGIQIDSYELVFDRAADPGEKNPQKLIQMGVIPICVGEGPWSKGRGEEPSVTLKVCRFLGLEDDPVYRKIMEVVESTHHSLGPGDWTRLMGFIRTYSLAHMDRPESSYTFFEEAVDSVRAEAIEEIRAQEDLRDPDRVLTFESKHRDRPVKVVAVFSDASMITRAARKAPFNADVVIRGDSAGFALVSARAGISLRKAVVHIRAEEYKLAGEEAPSDLACEGVAGPTDRWVLKADGGWESIINGGFTAPNFPPTRISLRDIATRVVWGLEGV